MVRRRGLGENRGVCFASGDQVALEFADSTERLPAAEFARWRSLPVKTTRERNRDGLQSLYSIYRDPIYRL